ncbi:hypothetical protein VC83_06909 [Pseudogymnoascus destructans]|uniref:Uncharacterized protein n=2 Tax=Pseudogymnoascus destructans TaxID=655981 RepID=L8FUT2_PSED2|nr:uncharacterized protein VC83_06909 [Pseudogymnoascus destructans]ELR04715.1 hypothetical protein GMDG_06944 [Pseudogymnoascus destructans 20631-21]OAF56959.1 hypothetical protein VC83_06909 [Pseudogymnoascus destructans]
MDFAPYQDTSPDATRTLSPPPTDRRSTSASPPFQAPHANPWAAQSGSPPPQQGGGFTNTRDVEMGGRGREALHDYDTSLPLRLDYEACLAYLALPPAGAVGLLLVEWKSDYVRFHAWQSALLFSAMFVVHLVFAWSSFLSWVLLVGDVGMIGYLTLRAYNDADTLDRCEVPFFGPLASRILDDE